MTMKTLTPAPVSTLPTIAIWDLMALLALNVGVTFVSFLAETPANLNKGATDGTARVNLHYKDITKTNRVNIMQGFDYKKRVNKVRAADGLEAREIGPRTNGLVHIPGTPYVRNENPKSDTFGRVYLSVEVMSVKVAERSYRVTSTGAKLDEATEIKPFESTSRGEIAYCNYGLDSLREITLNGQTYRVDVASAAAAWAKTLEVHPIATVRPVAVLPDTTAPVKA